ncbi:hypothetical protein LOTGIDRAFT_168712 [Lottia gigantea]|uniref:Uncharacterized protein n=1 Tax=Lottia gigantea TaxID=225164 RepID=V3ZU74_LOTGI|nr:hypothetical protein LOTGIDRAFT_168712 [Lottia gigantea]ESO84476.1 hypothetical protein LOTGIDRAFT_168712 [Lottia gigantea]
MPPPKKPKNGPTTVEQFLSHEELKNMTCKKEKLQTQSSNGSNNNSSEVEGKDSPLPETSNSGSQQAATGNGDSNNDKSSHKILRKIITTNAEGSVSSVQKSMSSSSDDLTRERELISVKIEQPDSDYENKYDNAATTVSVPSTGNNSTTPIRNGKMKTMAAVQYLKPQEKTSLGHFKNHFDTKQTGHSEISRTILATDHLHIFDQSVVRLPLTDTSVSQPSTSSLYSGMAVPNLPLYPTTVQPPVNNEPFDLSVKKNSIMEMMQNTKLTLSRSEQYGEVISRVGILPQGPVKMPPATISLSQALYLTGSSAKTASSSISPVSGVQLGDVRSSDALNPHLVVNLLTNRRLSPEDYPPSTVITPRSSSRDSQYPGRDTLPISDIPYG